MKKKIVSFIIDLLFYIFGCFIYSAAVTCIISANEISPGGFTGIATALNHMFLLPTGITLFILNVPVLLIGFINFGSFFVFKTAIATVILSFALDFTEALLPSFKIDNILASVFGGIFMGLGLSLVMLRGATTGGVDILAKLINKRFKSMTLGRIMLIMDAAVIIFAIFAYRNVESALYSIITIYAASKIMDIILYGGDKGKILFIISDKPERLSEAICSTLERGVTIIEAQGAYTGNKKKMLMCTVRRHEVSYIYKIIYDNDDKAFITVAEAGDIVGEGFKSISQ